MAATHKTRIRDPFRLNEPVPGVAGGSRRTSIIVRDKQFADIRARERLQRVLLWHDPDGARPTLSARDTRLLRRIAVENPQTNHAPMIRRSAMALLALSPTTEDLELLSELALAGEDFYVRSHALLALGTTGLKVVAPLLRDAMRATESTERQAAEAALKILARRTGPSTLRFLLETERDEQTRTSLERIRRSLGAKPAKKVAKNRTVGADASGPTRGT
jgi:HEAT repeat protein